MTAGEVVGAVALAIWLYLCLGRGGFWLMKPAEAPPTVSRATESVVAVVPARNEAGVVRQAVASLARQKYSGPLHIVVVDDDSSDGTADAAGDAAPPDRLAIVRSEPLPPGWTGKLWAVAQGVREAERFEPDYLLLTDADIVHASDGLLNLAALANEQQYDLVSWMARLRCESLAERALIPAFVFFFFLLYPPGWVRDPHRRMAAAAGGCILIRRSMLERIGGIARIRGELIDDCALARAVKQAGGRVWLGPTRQTDSIREYGTFAEIGRMISRTAFTQLRHSTWLLTGTLLGLALTYLAPAVLAFSANPFAIAAWVIMSVLYAPCLRYHRCSVLWAPLLPLIAVFYMGATLHSAAGYWRGTGGMWKGRSQAM
jgi:hopene-associated glycosyltransferase HpnB